MKMFLVIAAAAIGVPSVALGGFFMMPVLGYYFSIWVRYWS